MSPKWLVVGMLAVLALAAAGCPLLMVGSLGYQGYEYHKTGKLPGMPDKATPTSHSTSRPAASRTPSPSEVE